MTDSKGRELSGDDGKGRKWLVWRRFLTSDPWSQAPDPDQPGQFLFAVDVPTALRLAQELKDGCEHRVAPEGVVPSTTSDREQSYKDRALRPRR